MDSNTLYKRLDGDFALNLCRDEWRLDLGAYIAQSFRARQMGLLLDNTPRVEAVYSAVFPSPRVLDALLRVAPADSLLFTHHPMTWDIGGDPVFRNIESHYLPVLRERRISVYALHVPLDRNGPYSTTTCFARQLGIEPVGEFCPYFGVLVGVIGRTGLRSARALADHAASAVGHAVRLYDYGRDEIPDARVALVAGGGNDIDTLREMVGLGVTTLVTGVTACNDFSRPAHDFARSAGINLLGATHYSSEKFACMAMCEYFAALGLACTFLPDEPALEDL